MSSNHLICNAAGNFINDPRINWVAEENPQTFDSCEEFAKGGFGCAWTGNLTGTTLKPIMLPLIERPNIPIVFSHGDIMPRNLIFKGGLNKWRNGPSRIHIIDWEFAGWMPLYWEALKATFMECEPDSEWTRLIREVFPECAMELDADWEWRSRSRVTL
ncbi:hypothetical protein AMATHDRAFT_63171, partial [Amanita thiersii Skay4041]